MPEKSVYDTHFFVEYFYSGDADFRRKLKEDKMVPQALNPKRFNLLLYLSLQS